MLNRNLNIGLLCIVSGSFGLLENLTVMVLFFIVVSWLWIDFVVVMFL